MKFLRKDSNQLAFTILRFAIGGVFLWFGIDKWIDPLSWYGWVPGWVWPILPMSPGAFMALNGAFEFVVGLLLITGALPRLASAAAGLFLLGVVSTVGASDITVRDFALMGICLALFIRANSAAKRPWPKFPAAAVTAAYIIAFFIIGILYLRAR